jgi:hypothetical protein
MAKRMQPEAEREAGAIPAPSGPRDVVDPKRVRHLQRRQALLADPLAASEEQG